MSFRGEANLLMSKDTNCNLNFFRRIGLLLFPQNSLLITSTRSAIQQSVPTHYHRIIRRSHSYFPDLPDLLDLLASNNSRKHKCNPMHIFSETDPIPFNRTELQISRYGIAFLILVQNWNSVLHSAIILLPMMIPPSSFSQKPLQLTMCRQNEAPKLLLCTRTYFLFPCFQVCLI